MNYVLKLFWLVRITFFNIFRGSRFLIPKECTDELHQGQTRKNNNCHLNLKTLESGSDHQTLINRRRLAATCPQDLDRRGSQGAQAIRGRY